MESQFKQRLGSMLFHAGKIDKDQLEKSLQIQKEDQGYLGQIFLSNGYISEEDLYSAGSFPDIAIGLYEWAIIVDHRNKITWLTFQEENTFISCIGLKFSS